MAERIFGVGEKIFRGKDESCYVQYPLDDLLNHQKITPISFRSIPQEIISYGEKSSPAGMEDIDNLYDSPWEDLGYRRV